jgi:hypothetical protein
MARTAEGKPHVSSVDDQVNAAVEFVVAPG